MVLCEVVENGRGAFVKVECWKHVFGVKRTESMVSEAVEVSDSSRARARNAMQNDTQGVREC